MKGWPSCLPVSVMVTGPGWLAGISACQEPSVLLSVSDWPSRLADSRVAAWVVLTFAGLSGWFWVLMLHWYRLPCLSRAVILPPVVAACV